MATPPITISCMSANSPPTSSISNFDVSVTESVADSVLDFVFRSHERYASRSADLRDML
ncbi:hypothetical protein D3C76_1389720 [compost metagenome]